MRDPREIKTTLRIDAQGVERGTKAASRAIAENVKRPLKDVAAAAKIAGSELTQMWQKMERGPGGQFSGMKKSVREVRAEWRALGSEIRSVSEIMKLTGGGRRKLTDVEKMELSAARGTATASAREKASWEEHIKANARSRKEVKALTQAWDEANVSKHGLETNVKLFTPILNAFGLTAKGASSIVSNQFAGALDRSGKSMGGFIGALEKVDDVFDAAFNNRMVDSVNKLILSIEKGESATMRLPRAFDKSRISAELASQEIVKDFEKVAVALSKSSTFASFKDPLAAARRFLQIFQETNSYSKSFKQLRLETLETENKIAAATKQSAINIRDAQNQMRVSALKQAGYDSQLGLARKGKLNPGVASDSSFMSEATRLNNNYLATLNPMARAQQAFNVTLGESIAKNRGVADVSYAVVAAQAAYRNALKDVEAEAKRLSSTFNLTTAQSKILLEALRDEVNVIDALALATGKAVNKFDSLNVSARSAAATKRAFESNPNMGLAMKAGIDEERIAAIELNKQVDHIRQNFKITAQQASVVAEKIASGVPPGQALAESVRKISDYLSRLSGSASGLSAFNREMSLTRSVSKSVVAGLAGSSRAKEVADRMARRLSRTLKDLSLDQKVLSKQLLDGVHPLQAVEAAAAAAAKRLRFLGITFGGTGSALSGMNDKLGKVGNLFAGLFVIDRITTLLKQFIGGVISLAKEGAEFQTSMVSLAVSGMKLGDSWDGIKSAMRDVTSGMISQQTAATGLRVLLQSGIGLERSAKLMRAFEESTLRANLQTKGFQDRLLAGIEGVYDRQSRKVGNMTTLQTNFGQAMKLSDEDVMKYLTDIEKLSAKTELFGKTQTIVGESIRFYAGLMSEARLATGLLAVVTKTTQGQLAILDKQIKDLRITIGVALAPVLGAIAKLMNVSIIPALHEWIIGNLDLIRNATLLGVALSALVITIGSVATAIIAVSFAMTLSPVGWWTVAIVGLIAVLGTLYGALRGPKQALVDLVRMVGSSIPVFKAMIVTVSSLKEIWGLLTAEIRLWAVTMEYSLRETLGMIGAVSRVFAPAIAAMTDVAIMNIDKLRERLPLIFGAVGNDTIKDVKNRIKALEDETKAIDKSIERYKKYYAGPDADKNIAEMETDRARRLTQMAANRALLAVLQIPRDAENAANAAEGFLNDALSSIDELAAGLNIEKLKDPWVRFGNAANEAAKKTKDAATNITQSLLGLRGSLENLVSGMRGMITDVFFDEDTFSNRLQSFDRKFFDMINGLESKIDAKDIGFGKIFGDLEQQVNDARAGGDKGAIAQAILEQRMVTKEAARYKLVLSQIISTYGDIVTSAKALQAEVRKIFVSKEADREIASMKEFQSVSVETQKMIVQAETRNIARVYAQRIASLEMMARESKWVEENLHSLRMDLEKQANLEILRARSGLFRALEDIAVQFGEILKEELRDFFGMFKTGTEAIRNQQLAGKVRERQDRAQELINQVNLTAKSEEERQARIAEIQARSLADTRAMQEQAAAEVGDRWINAFKKVGVVIRDTLINTVVDNVIKKSIIPAIGDMFGKDAKAMFDGKMEVTLGSEVDAALESLGKIAFQENWSKELTALNTINTTLEQIRDHMGGGPAPQGEEPYGPQQQRPLMLPPLEIIGDAAETQKRVNEQLKKFRNGLNDATIAAGAIAALYTIFGSEMPSVLRLAIKIIAVLNIVLALHTLIKKIATIVESANTAAKVANTVATTAETAAKAANAAAALASVGVFVLLAIAAYAVFLLLPKIFKLLAKFGEMIGKLVLGLANAIVEIIKGVLRFGIEVVKIVPQILIAIVTAIAKTAEKIVGGVFDIIKAPFKLLGFASGGIVKSATTAMIGEGPDDEAILPLNGATFKMLGNAIAAAQSNGSRSVGSAAGLLGGQSGNTILQFNIDASNEDLVDELRREVEKTVIRVVKRNTIGMGGLA